MTQRNASLSCSIPLSPIWTVIFLSNTDLIRRCSFLPLHTSAIFVVLFLLCMDLYFFVILRLSSLFAFFPSRTHLHNPSLCYFWLSFFPINIFFPPFLRFFLELLCTQHMYTVLYVFRVSFFSGPSHHIIFVFIWLEKLYMSYERCGGNSIFLRMWESRLRKLN